MAQNASGKKPMLGVFALAMINVVIIASLRALPLMAEEGFSLVFFFLAAAFIFLIPSALVSAELATGWPKTGGVYVWTKEAFGERYGFLAIWLQWIQNVIWYPIALSFIAATIAYVFNPTLANNKFFVLIVILTVYWAATFANFCGIKISGLISISCGLAGTILPAVLTIVLGIVWLVIGRTPQISFSSQSLFPDMSHVRNIVFLAGVLLTYAGMEVSAVHAQEVKDPQRNYPRAIFIATLIVLAMFILGSLSVAIVIPQKQISLVAGLMEAFTVFFATYNLKWAIPIIALLITLGAMGQVSSWIIGPSKGLLVAARDGNLPPLLQHVNSRGVPIHILIAQAIIVTLISLVFLFMPTVSSSYWILTALTIQLYLIMYILMFAAAIKLRYSKPDVNRAYRIPGKNFGMWFVAVIGISGALFAIIIGFFPPAQLPTGNLFFFEAFLGLGIIIMCAVPLLIYQFRKPQWVQK